MNRLALLAVLCVLPLGIIPTGQGCFLVDPADSAWVMQQYSRVTSNGYVLVNERLLHRVLMSAPRQTMVDHENRNPLDNRRSNLRFATKPENARNSKRVTGATSPFRGVYYMSKAGKWRVSVRRDYKQHHLGVFDTAEEGALARDAFLDQHNDQFSIRSGLVSSDPPKRRIRVYARGADNILSKLTASARLEIHSLSAAGWFASSHRQTV